MDLQTVHRLDLLLPGNQKAVVDQLVCGLCLDLLLKPVSCKGGHTYCLQCIIRATQSSPTCPGGCNDSFPIREPNRNLVAQGCVDSLECRCPNAPAPAAPAPVATVEEPSQEEAKAEGDAVAVPGPAVTEGADSSSVAATLGEDEPPTEEADAEAGSPSSTSTSTSTSSTSSANGGIKCTWTGPFGQLCDHLERCGLEPCEIEGCAFEGKGGVLAAHRLACPKRRVPCPYCQVATALDSLEGHYGECKEMAVLCPFAWMGCHTTLARKSMPMHLLEDRAQHASLADVYQSESVPSATIELTIKNVQQKIAGKTSVNSQTVPLPLVGFPQGQVYLDVRFGSSNGGVQRDGKTLGVSAYFTCPGAPVVEPPPEICYQGTTVTLVSQDGAVKNVEKCGTKHNSTAPLGQGTGCSDFCQDVTPFVKDDTIVVRATIRARPAAPAAAALKHTVA